MAALCMTVYAQAMEPSDTVGGKRIASESLPAAFIPGRLRLRECRRRSCSKLADAGKITRRGRSWHHGWWNSSRDASRPESSSTPIRPRKSAVEADLFELGPGGELKRWRFFNDRNHPQERALRAPGPSVGDRIREARSTPRRPRCTATGTTVATPEVSPQCRVAESARWFTGRGGFTAYLRSPHDWWIRGEALSMGCRVPVSAAGRGDTTS